jgi:hypothetical protein
MEGIKILNKREELKKNYKIKRGKQIIKEDPIQLIMNLKEDLTKANKKIEDNLVTMKVDLEKQINEKK